MPVTPQTREATRANTLVIAEVASTDNIDSPASGDRAVGGVSGAIVTKDASGNVHYLHGSEQQLAVSPKLAKCSVKAVETEVECSGATVTASNLVAAKNYLLGVVIRVTEAITGATSFSIGDGSDADRFGATIAITLGTTTSEANFTASPVGFLSSALSVVLTAAGADFTDGKVRITAFYIEMDGPTS